ncbi:MAG: Calx-beta domain-containing protein [Pseudomonadota bacterium]
MLTFQTKNECDALVALYNSTDGPNWGNSTGWLETNKVCNRFNGVKCANGRVISLSLSDNRLTGKIPSELGNFTDMDEFFLNDNELCGEIPVELQNLSKGNPFFRLRLDNNHLTASDPDMIAWLDRYNPGWEESQTPCTKPGTLQFSSATYSVNEGDGSVKITVTRVNGSHGAVSVKYASSDDTAKAGEDYTKVKKGKLSWGDGDASDKTFTVYITDDTVLEGDETFNLMLKNATGGATINDPGTTEVTIADDDQTPVSTLQFSSATYSVDENDGTVKITVTRVNGTHGAVSVKYASSDDTAKAGEDYTKVKKGKLSWGDGDASDKTFTVDINDDTIVEDDETFNLTLKNATGGATIGDPATAVVTITDDDSTEKHSILQFSKTEFTVKENVHTAQAIITVERIGGSDGIVLVEHATSDDSAKADSDYTETKGGVRWEDGDDDDKTFLVHIINDDKPENDETFIVSLANPIGGAQIGTPDTATVTIKDNDNSDLCKKVTGISKKECQALIALYDSTDGENWTNNTGWKATKSPCNWYGMNCQGGHVTGLTLGNNNLKGSISKKLSKLKQLKILLLNNNKLSGNIPSSLMKLKKLTYLDLNDNCLEKRVSKKLGKWLDDLNPGWHETQTNCLY